MSISIATLVAALGAALTAIAVVAIIAASASFFCANK